MKGPHPSDEPNPAGNTERSRRVIELDTEGPSARLVAYIIACSATAALFVIHFDDIISSLNRIAGAFTPILYGGVIAFLLNLIMVRLEALPLFGGKTDAARKARRPICIAASMAVVLLVFGIAGTIAVLQLKDSVSAIGQGLATAWTAILAFIEPFDLEGRFVALFGGETPDWGKALNDVLARLGGFDGIVDSAVGVGDAVVRTAIDLSLGCVFACYLLMAKERVLAGAKTFCRTVLPKRWSERVATVFSTANGAFSRFIGGQCTEAVILGTLCALGMTILRLPHAIAVGLIVGITALVPIFGAWVGGIIGALMILPNSVNQAVVFVIFLVLLQQVENHFIYPRTMGSATGISSIWVMSAVVVGGALGGIVGMMTAVPLVSTAKQLLDRYRKREECEELIADETSTQDDK